MKTPDQCDCVKVRVPRVSVVLGLVNRVLAFVFMEKSTLK